MDAKERGNQLAEEVQRLQAENDEKEAGCTLGYHGLSVTSREPNAIANSGDGASPIIVEEAKIDEDDAPISNV